jgi:putative ABC transport system permease protein
MPSISSEEAAMGYLLRMALRNIWRNTRRSILAMTSVGLAVLLCVFLQGFIGGYVASVVKNYTKNETGHIRITSTQFLERGEFLPVDTLVPDPAAVEAKIAAEGSIREKIAVFTERFRFGVLLENQGNNASAIALAGDPRVEAGLLALQRCVREGGRYIGGPGQTILGAGLARQLKLSVGDALKVVTEASDGSLQMKKFRIVGLFQTGVTAMDDSVFQIPLEDAKSLLRTGGGAQSILIMLKDYRDSGAVAARLRELLADPALAVLPWTAIGDYPRLIQFQERAFNYLLLVVLFLGAFIVTNIMMMVVLERRREIGIIKSLGFSNAEVLALFSWEGIILGLWGSLAGAALGLGVNLFLHLRGLDFGSALGSLSFPLDNVIYPRIDIPATLGIVALGALIAGLASLLPSRRAARMSVVQAIKSV